MEEKNKLQEIKKLNIIRRLKDYKDHDKITNLLQEFNQKQNSDYFLTQNNIKIGKLNPIKNKYYDKNNNLIPYSYVGPSSLFPNSPKRSTLFKQNSIMKYRCNSLSSSKIMEKTKYKDSLNINQNHIIDNKSLKNYYNDIRKRISEEKTKNEGNKKFLLEIPFYARKSLIDQEKTFRKILKENRIKNIMEEKIKRKCNKKSIDDLLINKSKNFDKKNEELSIIDKNITIDNKYRDNLWNITLRNTAVNGRYEKDGYLNVGNKDHPMFTIFKINKNIEYFTNPRHERNKTSENINNKLYLTLNENNYNLKIKNNLNVLNTIKNLEINGKNLLDTEDKRESEIKGKKILYNKHDLDYLFFKQKDKGKNDKEINDINAKSILDKIYEEKTYVKNYKKIDFFKNANLTSKYYNNVCT